MWASVYPEKSPGPEDGRLPVEHARMEQLQQHALDAIRMLADILDEQDAALDWYPRRPDQVGDGAQVAAPQDAGGRARRLVRRAHGDAPARLRQRSPELPLGEFRDGFAAEIETGGRPRQAGRPGGLPATPVATPCNGYTRRELARIRKQPVVDARPSSRDTP